MIQNGNSSGERIFSRIQFVPSYWNPVPINGGKHVHSSRNPSTGWEYYSKLKNRKDINEGREEEILLNQDTGKLRSGVSIDWSLIGEKVKSILKSDIRSTTIITSGSPV
eukprot:gnl/Chilomastix_caulleri/6107.p1 GENE.gnl/Chilomastix_caulleri/6107~~gnl/Chilomastix_caulleri/6107.p1  ORF type:complete len:118 (+),score=14.76 gnl/Chilomastix_caulleri/6107:30-356(+)